MEPFHHPQQQDRRMLGQTITGGGGDHHPWYLSSSPPQPPLPPAGYYNHLPHHQQHSYHYQPHHLPPPHHHPQPQQAIAPPPYPPPHHNQYPPPLPPRPHHPMPTPSAYPPPPNQAWGNPSWTQHQGWEYQEQRLPNSNGEDWAARAKAWAAAEAGTENHHTSHFQSVGRIDDHRHAYHDRYQLPSGPARDVQQPPFPQLSNQQLTVGAVDPLKQVNYMHGSTSIGPGPTSYGTGYNAGDETTNRNADHIASPQKNYGPSSSIYEQEVSYSYSSAPGTTSLAAVGYSLTSIEDDVVNFTVIIIVPNSIVRYCVNSDP